MGIVFGGLRSSKIRSKVSYAECYRCGQTCSDREGLFLATIIHWGKHDGRTFCADCLLDGLIRSQKNRWNLIVTI